MEEELLEKRLVTLENNLSEMHADIRAIASMKKNDDQVDYDSYRVFSEAKKKLLGWLAFALAILTAFGVWSIKDVIDTVKEKAESSAQQAVSAQVQEITQTAVEKASQTATEKAVDIIQESKGQLQDVIQLAISETKSSVEKFDRKIDADAKELFKRIEENVNKKIEEILGEVQTRIESQVAVQVEQATSTDTDEKRYDVMVASSVKKSDLEEERNRVLSLLRSQGKLTEYKDIKICPPKGSARAFVLLAGENLSYHDAKKLRDKAVSDGFRRDAWIHGAGESRTYVCE